jgi:ketosteroid isomerase-like protein
MSEENVELVRRAIEAGRRKPNPDYDTINVLFHPDHQLVSLIQRLEGGVAEGAQGFRDFLADNEEVWERWDTEIEDVRSIDDNRVLVAEKFTGVSKGGGVPVKESLTEIFTVREGKIARTEVYSSREEALEAAGLRE